MDLPPGGSCRPHTGGRLASTAALQHDAAGGVAVLVGLKRAAAAAAAPPAGGRVLEAVGVRRRSSGASDHTGQR